MAVAMILSPIIRCDNNLERLRRRSHLLHPRDLLLSQDPYADANRAWESAQSLGETEQQKQQMRNARLITLLGTFDDGDAEEQQRDLANLQSGIEAARPGQRQVFGDGFNP